MHQTSGYLKDEMEEEFSYRTLLRYLHEENYNLRFPRKTSLKQDEAKREAYKIRLKCILEEPNAEVWFEDESGIEGDPRPRRRWAKRGKKGTIPYQGLHIRQNILGAVCPNTGEFVSILFDYCDRQSFQALIDEIAKHTLERSKSKKVYIILDNASWHKTKCLNWHHLNAVYLPPYSPDYNPIERLWLNLKSQFFSDFIAITPEELINRICFAIMHYVKNSEQVASICKIAK